jgi:hypothetical protein
VRQNVTQQNKIKMSHNIEMVYSACTEWFNDWVSTHPVELVDEWDLSEWMTHEMYPATQMFLEYGFHSPRARNDALMILRALYYEYFLFQVERSHRGLRPNTTHFDRLKAAPQTTQKSGAWHTEAREVLSGHEFGALCVGSASERANVIQKKCAPLAQRVAEDDADESTEQTVFLSGENGLSAFKWGWRYEPVARQLFETLVANSPVYDGLGRVRHTTLPRLGASPDGLILEGPRAGRLLEIKCPISRIIDGKIPIRYYCQMQLQAEVCDVDAVDYVEVQFGILSTQEQLVNAKQPRIGTVCVTASSSDTDPSLYKYEYSPLFEATPEGYAAMQEWSPIGPVILERTQWYVKDWFTTTVMRNRRWWHEVGFPAYTKFWDDVDALRATGFTNRKPLFIDSGSERSAASATSNRTSPVPECDVDSDTIAAIEDTSANDVETAPISK